METATARAGKTGLLNAEAAQVAAVIALTACLIFILLAYVAAFSNNVPYYDEWAMVDVLGQTQPLTVNWLWEQHNDHRIPLPKIVLVGLYTLSGWDFRVGMYFNVLLLSLITLRLLRVALRVDRRQVYALAFFPLLLLHVGHYENLLWSWQVTQVIPVVLVLYLLSIMVESGTRLSSRQTLQAGTALVALPLCGAPGLVYVPGLALWLAEAGRQHLRSAPPAGTSALVAWGCAAAALALIPLYFFGFTPTARASLEPLQLISTVVAFAAYGLGPAAPTFLPLSYLLVLAICVASVIVLLNALRREDDEVRSKAWAMLFFLAAYAGLALSAAVARPGVTFPPRYMLIAVPLLCWIYFVWLLFPPPRLARRARLGLAVLAAATIIPNTSAGYSHGRIRDGLFREFASDLRAGMPPSELIARHQYSLLPWPRTRYWHGWLTESFETLRQNQVGVFSDLQADPPFRELPLEAAAARVAATDREDESDQVWVLHEPTFVHGMRVLSAPPAGSGSRQMAQLTVSWRPAGTETFSEERTYHHWWQPSQTAETLWVYEEIKELEVKFDAFGSGKRITKIVFLLSDAHEGRGTGH